jgi:hypothetical protein
MKRLAAVTGFVLLAAPTASCSEDCGNVDCGSGVSVTWTEDDLPERVTAVRLCVDGVCKEPVAPVGPVAPDSAPPVKDITVELTLLGDRAEVLDVWEWTGDRKGGCCPYVELRPSGGELEPVPR